MSLQGEVLETFALIIPALFFQIKMFFLVNLPFHRCKLALYYLIICLEKGKNL